MPSAFSVEPLDLTIAIPARNEERNLPDCLRAIGRDFAKRIVLLDSGSTDRTCEIAREVVAKFSCENFARQALRAAEAAGARATIRK